MFFYFLIDDYGVLKVLVEEFHWTLIVLMEWITGKVEELCWGGGECDAIVVGDCEFGTIIVIGGGVVDFVSFLLVIVSITVVECG